MRPQHHDQSGVSEASMSLVNSEEGREPLRPKQYGLTITVEKIDHILAAVQLQIEGTSAGESRSGTGQGAIG